MSPSPSVAAIAGSSALMIHHNTPRAPPSQPFNESQQYQQIPDSSDANVPSGPIVTSRRCRLRVLATRLWQLVNSPNPTLSRLLHCRYFTLMTPYLTQPPPLTEDVDISLLQPFIQQLYLWITDPGIRSFEGWNELISEARDLIPPVYVGSTQATVSDLSNSYTYDEHNATQPGPFATLSDQYSTLSAQDTEYTPMKYPQAGPGRAPTAASPSSIPFQTAPITQGPYAFRDSHTAPWTSYGSTFSQNITNFTQQNSTATQAFASHAGTDVSYQNNNTNDFEFTNTTAPQYNLSSLGSQLAPSVGMSSPDIERRSSLQANQWTSGSGSSNSFQWRHSTDTSFGELGSRPGSLFYCSSSCSGRPFKHTCPTSD